MIVTLVYLAVGIRQNTASVRGTALQSLKADAVAHLEHIFRDPDLTRIWYSGTHEIDSLQGLDHNRFHLMMLSYLRRIENFHQLSARGLSDEEWRGFRESFLEAASRPGVLKWWSTNAFRYNPGFRAFIDHELGKRAAQQGAAADEPQRVPRGP